MAPVNETDTVFLPEGLNASKGVARLADLKIDVSYLNLGGGFNSGHNRKAVFNVGFIPNIKETRATERSRSAGGSGCLTRRRCQVGGQSAGESMFYRWNAENTGYSPCLIRNPAYRCRRCWRRLRRTASRYHQRGAGMTILRFEAGVGGPIGNRLDSVPSSPNACSGGANKSTHQQKLKCMANRTAGISSSPSS